MRILGVTRGKIDGWIDGKEGKLYGKVKNTKIREEIYKKTVMKKDKFYEDRKKKGSKWVARWKLDKMDKENYRSLKYEKSNEKINRKREISQEWKQDG